MNLNKRVDGFSSCIFQIPFVSDHHFAFVKHINDCIIYIYVYIYNILYLSFIKTVYEKIICKYVRRLPKQKEISKR